MKDNIVLIGMPGVGKSTAGVILAKILGFSFEDSDLIIQKREGRLLKDIIADEGVDGFLAIENAVNASLDFHHTVIATGGSAVYGKEAMAHLKETGTVIYLRVPFETIEKRLSDIRGRGVTLRDGQTLKNLYDEREPLYEKQADVIIDEYDLSIEETVARMVSAL